MSRKHANPLPDFRPAATPAAIDAAELVRRCHLLASRCPAVAGGKRHCLACGQDVASGAMAAHLESNHADVVASINTWKA